MAPDETSATSRRSRTSVARSSTSRAMTSPEGPWPGSVTNPLPTLTTIRRARVSAWRASMVGPDAGLPSLIGSPDRVERGWTADHATRQSSSHVLDHRPDAGPGGGRDSVKRQSAARAELLERATPIPRAGQVDLVGCYDFLPRRQFRRVRQQLVVDRVIVLHGIPGIVGIEVDQVDQNAGPLDVAQETVAQALAFRRARDQTRYVRNHEAPVLVDPNDPERGSESREGIVGDLGLGRRHTRHERGLADVRYANDAHVGEELELEAYPALLASASEVSASRGAIRRAREASVASSTARAGGR